jgi:hypothetical protein
MFAGSNWNEWYAWILGHNLDLWMLSLPLVGIPLLFYTPRTQNDIEAQPLNP